MDRLLTLQFTAIFVIHTAVKFRCDYTQVEMHHNFTTVVVFILVVIFQAWVIYKSLLQLLRTFGWRRQKGRKKSVVSFQLHQKLGPRSPVAKVIEKALLALFPGEVYENVEINGRSIIRISTLPSNKLPDTISSKKDKLSLLMVESVYEGTEEKGQTITIPHHCFSDVKTQRSEYLRSLLLISNSVDENNIQEIVEYFMTLFESEKKALRRKIEIYKNENAILVDQIKGLKSYQDDRESKVLQSRLDCKQPTFREVRKAEDLDISKATPEDNNQQAENAFPPSMKNGKENGLKEEIALGIQETKEHVAAEKKLHKQKNSLPLDERRFMLHGLTPGTEKEYIKMYVEGRAQREDEPTLYFLKGIEDKAIVEFPTKITDFQRLGERIRSRTLRNSQPRLERLQVPNRISFLNVKELKFSKEDFILALERPVIGGGDVIGYKHDSGNNAALITFKHFKVVDGLLQRGTVNISGKTLQVFPYYGNGFVISKDELPLKCPCPETQH